MANSGADGTFTIIGPGGNPEGFTVEVWEDDWIFGEIFLGKSKTNISGDFAVRYKPNTFGGRDLIIRLYDPVLRLVHDTGIIQKDITDTIYLVPELNLAKLVTN